METLLVCLLAGYGVWLAALLWWERRRPEEGRATRMSPPTVQRGRGRILSAGATFDEGDDAKECHSDATNHHARKRNQRRKSRYICPRNRKPKPRTHPRRQAGRGVRASGNSRHPARIRGRQATITSTRKYRLHRPAGYTSGASEETMRRCEPPATLRRTMRARRAGRTGLRQM